MTIETEFFEAFGIKDRTLLHSGGGGWGADVYEYTKITPEIVLGLEEIVLLVNDDYNFSVEHFDNEARFLFCDRRTILENESNLKNCILSSCIQLKDEIQDQVRQLFK